MTIEERRAELVAFVENEYGGQEVLKLADAYAMAVHDETLAGVNDLLEEIQSPTHNIVLAGLRQRIEALR